MSRITVVLCLSGCFCRPPSTQMSRAPTQSDGLLKLILCERSGWCLDPESEMDDRISILFLSWPVHSLGLTFQMTTLWRALQQSRPGRSWENEVQQRRKKWNVNYLSNVTSCVSRDSRLALSSYLEGSSNSQHTCFFLTALNEPQSGNSDRDKHDLQTLLLNHRWICSQLKQGTKEVKVNIDHLLCNQTQRCFFFTHI